MCVCACVNDLAGGYTCHLPAKKFAPGNQVPAEVKVEGKWICALKLSLCGGPLFGENFEALYVQAVYSNMDKDTCTSVHECGNKVIWTSFGSTYMYSARKAISICAGVSLWQFSLLRANLHAASEHMISKKGANSTRKQITLCSR